MHEYLLAHQSPLAPSRRASRLNLAARGCPGFQACQAFLGDPWNPQVPRVLLLPLFQDFQRDRRHLRKTYILIDLGRSCAPTRKTVQAWSSCCSHRTRRTCEASVSRTSGNSRESSEADETRSSLLPRVTGRTRKSGRTERSLRQQTQCTYSTKKQLKIPNFNFEKRAPKG